MDAASLAFAELEGLLRAFVEHYGMEPWKGVYAFDHEFERYRLVELARLTPKTPSSADKTKGLCAPEIPEMEAAAMRRLIGLVRRAGLSERPKLPP